MGDLITAADAGAPLDNSLKIVADLKRRTFGWTKGTFEMTVATLPLTSSTTFIGAGVMFLINALVKDYGAAATIGAAAAGAHISRSRQKTEQR